MGKAQPQMKLPYATTPNLHKLCHGWGGEGGGGYLLVNYIFFCIAMWPQYSPHEHYICIDFCYLSAWISLLSFVTISI